MQQAVLPRRVAERFPDPFDGRAALHAPFPPRHDAPASQAVAAITPPDIYSRQGAVTKDRLEGKVEFRNVSFSYEGAQPALRDISLDVDPRQMIGLCGPSGAEKCTFVNLLCRFYDVTDGQILIDGTDIRDYDVRWLRRQIGLVLQEPYLFHGTIAENIR